MIGKLLLIGCGVVAGVAIGAVVVVVLYRMAMERAFRNFFGW